MWVTSLINLCDSPNIIVTRETFFTEASVSEFLNNLKRFHTGGRAFSVQIYFIHISVLFSQNSKTEAS